MFRGDTVVARASMAHPVPGAVATLEFETDDGQVHRETVEIPAPAPVRESGGLSSVARLAAAIGLSRADDTTGLATALRYRLISPWTHCLVVAPRAEQDRAREAPKLRKVPQTLAAGWGGSGARVLAHRAGPLSAACIAGDSFEDMPMFRSSRSQRDQATTDRSLEGLDLRLPPRYRQLLDAVRAAGPLELCTARFLVHAAGLDDKARHLFDLADDSGINPDLIAAALLAALLGGPLREFLDDDDARKANTLGRRVSDVLGRLAELVQTSQSALEALIRVQELADDPQIHARPAERLVPDELLEGIHRLRRLERLSDLSWEIDRVLQPVAGEIASRVLPA